MMQSRDGGRQLAQIGAKRPCRVSAGMVPASLIVCHLATVGLAPLASAASTIYRCVQNGQTVLTDKPCDGATTGTASPTASVSPPGVIASGASAASSVVGDWRGQTQYQASVNAARVAEAQSVAPLVLTFSADGKVTGSSPANGCNVLGIWSPGATVRLFMLDVSLNGCRYARFNQRYSGTLLANFPERMAQLSLIANTAPIPGQPIWRFAMEGTLRR